MAAPRGRGPRLGRLLRALVRFAFLVILGFGVGLAIGLVTEEPGMLYEHLSGENESVDLAERKRILEVPNPPNASPNEAVAPDGSDVGPIAERIASAPSTGTQESRLALKREPGAAADLPRVAAPLPKEKARAAPIAGSGPPASAGSGEQWAIQVGAFSEEQSARRLVATLEAKNYPVAVLPSTDSSQRWRVRVQPIRGEERARDMADQLKRDERLPTWLIPLETGSR